jgi:hypothetical protein
MVDPKIKMVDAEAQTFGITQGSCLVHFLSRIGSEGVETAIFGIFFKIFLRNISGQK